MAVTVTRETQPRITLQGANSGTVSNGILVGSGDGERVHITFTATAEPIIVIPEGPVSNVQLEAGSFPTSYIPNTADSGTVTRSPDIASIPVSAFGYNQDAGTVVVEALAPVGDNDNRLAILVEAGTANNRVVDLYRQSTGVRMYDGSTVLHPSAPSVPATGLKVAGAYSAGDYAAVVDGGSPATSTTASVNTPDTLYVGSNGLSQRQLNGHIKSLKYYPRRLTDAQLQELTA